ncbi:MAG: hypothetical protein ACR2GL_02025 [Thermoleophilaceae bacterium]
MGGAARGATSAGASPDSADGQGRSPLAALSGAADRMRAKVTERVGPEPAERLRSVAGERLKAVGGDRLPSGAGERLRGVTSGTGSAADSTQSPPPFEERPELYVGAAFAGGIVLAGCIRLLGR